jgi:general secretion pathway protein G
MNRKSSLQKGFTLVELLIVVIILSILAAIVIPQFSASTDDAKAASLDSTLGNLRSMIDLYYQQHGEYPGALTAVPTQACSGTAGAGAAATAGAVLEQLSRYTDDQGGVCSMSDTVNHRFGPYYKKDALPADPIKNVSTFTVVASAASGNLVMTADGTAGGWKYDSKTGKIIMNHTDYDDR